MINIDTLIRGSIDFHIHAGPDTMPCHVDAVEAAVQAKKAGMSGIVLKNHFYSTAPLASIVNHAVPGVRTFGSICLNYEVGGINVHAVEAALQLGAKVVWMPTLSSSNSRSKISRVLDLKLRGKGFSILDARGNLKPGIRSVLLLVKKHKAVLATGHIAPQETFSLVAEAKTLGIQKVIITHANNTSIVEDSLSLEEQKELINQGYYIEYTGDNYVSYSGEHDLDEIVESIKAIGAQNIVLSTDMGPVANPPPVDGMRMLVSALLSRGLSSAEIEFMIKTNPAKLLDVEK